eukprot:scaffold64591_cov33-Phaeocystis_antarctica.AAC.1
MQPSTVTGQRALRFSSRLSKAVCFIFSAGLTATAWLVAGLHSSRGALPPLPGPASASGV